MVAHILDHTHVRYNVIKSLQSSQSTALLSSLSLLVIFFSKFKIKLEGYLKSAILSPIFN